jgi:heme-degrading monooxygenase HmoA
MFVAVYQFDVKEGECEKFKKAWAELTKLIYQYEGSLGSRLHQENETTYIAYAQWPSRQTWENSGSKLPEEANHWRSEMRAACQNIATLHELESDIDLLKDKLH